MCGETRPDSFSTRSHSGPSPRVRGKPAPRGPRPQARRVHPRVCGETSCARPPNVRETGPSPRVRGNHAPGVDPHVPVGSIPACAGKRASNSDSVDASKVHPRVCGETMQSRSRRGQCEGPSPRVRGNQAVGPFPAPFPGSIPACAGKPNRRSASRCVTRVHPRVCGETSFAAPLGSC